MRTLLLVAICLAAANCYTMRIQHGALSSCQARWTYFAVADTLSGRIISHQPLLFMCGIVPSAALSIVETTTGDTVRVLSLCGFRSHSQQQRVKVLRADAGASNTVIPPDAYHCTVRRTCYGTILEVR